MEISPQVVVVPYDPDWPRQFEVEAARLRPVYGDNLVGIQHIGSTSVPGLDAKPIIDILVEVKVIEQVDLINEGMNALGYEAMGEYGIPGRRYFRRAIGGRRTHHVHTFQADSQGSRRHIAFRNYLRSHEEAARAYAQLKNELAKRFSQDLAGYVDGKDAFVKKYEKIALEWDSQS